MVFRWYVIHTSSGAEKRVKQLILDHAAKHEMSKYFEEIVVPVIDVSEVKRGKVVQVEKKIMPGYVLIKMNMNDEVWHLIKNIPKITGFLGEKSKPSPLTDKEIESVFSQIEIQSKGIATAKLYSIGESVTVVDGPFDTFSGIIEEVDNDKKRVRVSVLIFGKATPIDLSFTQVKKSN